MMLRFCSLFGCAGMLALTVACTNSPGPDTREADIQAVRAVETAWVQDVAKKDVDSFAKYYADDASVLMPNSPILNGKEAIRGALKPMLADPNFALTFQSSRVEASKGGDFVYTQGSYTMTMSDAKQKATTDKGKYLTIFRKQADGTWKAVADMINSDLAPAPPAPEPPAKKRSKGRD
jgi:uncharacterized protein (TIGR02246 family)